MTTWSARWTASGASRTPARSRARLRVAGVHGAPGAGRRGAPRPGQRLSATCDNVGASFGRSASSRARRRWATRTSWPADDAHHVHRRDPGWRVRAPAGHPPPRRARFPKTRRGGVRRRAAKRRLHATFVDDVRVRAAQRRNASLRAVMIDTLMTTISVTTRHRRSAGRGSGRGSRTRGAGGGAQRARCLDQSFARLGPGQCAHASPSLPSGGARPAAA